MAMHTTKLLTTAVTTTLFTTAFLTACSTPHQNTDANNQASSSNVITPSNSQLQAETKIASLDTIASAPRVLPKQMGSNSYHVMPPMPMPPSVQNHENYQDNKANPVHRTIEDAISTFSIDTDTGSYANVRRFLNDGQLPPTDAVRYEELINYFNYDFTNAMRKNNAPFKVSLETVKAPWKATNNIIKVAIKSTDEISDGASRTLPPSNLVFLVDVSGSMSSKDKLAMAKSSLKMLTKQLRKQDTISLITYAGNTEIVLPATQGNQQAKILAAIDRLNASGSTNGEAAIKLAYQQAKQNFKKDGINRILMLTDGDFNVGVSSTDEMLDIIKRNRDNGVSLSTFGFGTGNYNEHMMEQVADNGNGNYSYIDSVNEAKKALIDEMSATFNTVAKDVKVQVEFNPATISEWRLIGYENRILADEDFNNDKVDAGELGAGKSVVALFEVTPVGQKGYLNTSRYQATTSKPTTDMSNELGYLKIRYKAPQGSKSKLLEYPIVNSVNTPSNDLKFALAVAGYGQLLKGSKYTGSWTYNDVANYAKQGLSKDPLGTRHEFVKLVKLADALK